MVVISLPIDPLAKPLSRPSPGPSTAQAVVLLPSTVGPLQQRPPKRLKKTQQVLQHLVAARQLKK